MTPWPQHALSKWKNCRESLPYGPRPVEPPKKIVFYRDGVSEGEFDKVAEQVIPQIKGARLDTCRCRPPLTSIAEAYKACGIPRDKWPQILFIVVGKR